MSIWISIIIAGIINYLTRLGSVLAINPKKMSDKTLEVVKGSIKKSKKNNKKLPYVDKVILALQNGDEKTIEEMMMYHSDYYGSDIKGKQIYYIEGIKKNIKNGIVIQILTPDIKTKFIGHKFKLI